MSAQIILVIDDEHGIALLTKRILTGADYEVYSFTEPRAGLEYLSQNPVDLLLVDIRMPVLDGFSVIDQAKRQRPDLAVLVMTGFGTVETAIQALRQGVDGLILKPFDNRDELINACRQALIDNQQKRDVARIQALRPLFNVAETLLVETRPERLLELILDAVTGHLHCSHAGYYQNDSETKTVDLLKGRGNTLPNDSINSPEGIIGHVAASGNPFKQHVTRTEAGEAKGIFQDHDLETIMCVPVVRPTISGVIFAGRESGQPIFSDADMEMFQILGRQAAIALENARLYGDLRDYIRRVEESQQALIQAEKMAAAGRLTASIAHEINNPLQAVQNCLHLAGRDDLPAERREEYFELANSELHRLMSTVRKMLEYYRPGREGQDTICISDVMERVLNLLRKQLSDRNIHINVDIPATLPSITAVGNQIQQVFMNLILNAYDVMPNGGEITVSAQKIEDEIEISFTDTGPGVVEENRNNIFEPFMSTKQGGTGLGLTVSYNIVTDHGGKLELDPSSEAGACFRVTLPVRKEK